MIDKYCQLYPNFHANYRQSIKKLKTRISIDAALSYLRSRQKSNAKALIAPCRWADRKAFLVFLITLLPMNIITMLYKLKGIFIISSPLSEKIDN